MAISRYSTTPEQILDDSDYKRVYSDKFNQNKRHFLSNVEVGEIIRVPKPIGEVLATLGY